MTILHLKIEFDVANKINRTTIAFKYAFQLNMKQFFRANNHGKMVYYVKTLSIVNIYKTLLYNTNVFMSPSLDPQRRSKTCVVYSTVITMHLEGSPDRLFVMLTP